MIKVKQKNKYKIINFLDIYDFETSLTLPRPSLWVQNIFSLFKIQHHTTRHSNAHITTHRDQTQGH